MCGEQARELGSCGIWAIDDESHEEQGEGQILCVEVHDEEADLARRVVLRERVCVRERERGEEGVAVEDAAC
jgi:stress response protein YsnF